VLCVQCERLQSIAISAARSYHSLAADLECSYLSHNTEAQMLLSIRLKQAFTDSETARVELFLHEKIHRLKKLANGVPLTKRHSA